MPFDIVTGRMYDQLDALDAVGGQGGYGPIDIVGQELPGGVKGRIVARDAVAINRDAAWKAREYPLGFDSENLVAGGAVVTINSQPQIPFRAERLVVPSDIAGAFVLQDLRIGKDSQFANDQPVPARVFDERGVGVRLRGNTAQISQDVVLRVENVSGAPVRFRAAVIGTALDY